MAKRKMITTANGPDGAFLSGETYDFGALGLEELGQQFEDGGYAERIFEAAVEPQGERAVEEPAEVPNAEALPRWPLKRWGPQAYLEEHGSDAKHSELAQNYVAAGKPNA